MHSNYCGDTTAKLPTAAGVVANAKVTTNTVALGGGYRFEQKVLGGHGGARRQADAVQPLRPCATLQPSAFGNDGGCRVESAIAMRDTERLEPCTNAAQRSQKRVRAEMAHVADSEEVVPSR